MSNETTQSRKQRSVKPPRNVAPSDERSEQERRRNEALYISRSVTRSLETALQGGKSVTVPVEIDTHIVDLIPELQERLGGDRRKILNEALIYASTDHSPDSKHLYSEGIGSKKRSLQLRLTRDSIRVLLKPESLDASSLVEQGLRSLHERLIIP